MFGVPQRTSLTTTIVVLEEPLRFNGHGPTCWTASILVSVGWTGRVSLLLRRRGRDARAGSDVRVQSAIVLRLRGVVVIESLLIVPGDVVRVGQGMGRRAMLPPCGSVWKRPNMILQAENDDGSRWKSEPAMLFVTRIACSRYGTNTRAENVAEDNALNKTMSIPHFESQQLVLFMCCQSD